eukprot:Rhum_TRINITY_DN15187_c16_g1::Rhum_TRINITY_DN15187_c16_g1_i1::g.142796::m.142796
MRCVREVAQEEWLWTVALSEQRGEEQPLPLEVLAAVVAEEDETRVDDVRGGSAMQLLERRARRFDGGSAYPLAAVMPAAAAAATFAHAGVGTTPCCAASLLTTPIIGFCVFACVVCLFVCWGEKGRVGRESLSLQITILPELASRTEMRREWGKFGRGGGGGKGRNNN